MSGIETTFETTFERKSGSRPQRMDVIPAGAARRMWAPAAKARIVEESFVAGANIAAIALANDLLPQQLYAWRHTVLKAREMAFVPVVVDEPGPPPRSVSSAAEIVIQAGTMTIHVPENVTGGLPTEALIADVIVRKYADHGPFYRQAQALRRQGIEIDRGTMCNWSGRSAAWLGRITRRMKAELLSGDRLFVDETTARVLAPRTGKTKIGYLWATARDDRAHGGTDPPAVVYSYLPGRGKVWAAQLLGSYTGIVQCDGYGAYKHIEAPDRAGGAGKLAFC